jgi:hypothetical protein
MSYSGEQDACEPCSPKVSTGIVAVYQWHRTRVKPTAYDKKHNEIEPATVRDLYWKSCLSTIRAKPSKG